MNSSNEYTQTMFGDITDEEEIEKAHLHLKNLLVSLDKI